MATKSGLSLGTILFLIFLVLKITHNIDWSWWWVTSPLWIGVVIWLGLVVIVGFFGVLIAFLNAIFNKK
jgi:hypothetical protein